MRPPVTHISALDVANYFLYTANDTGSYISNLKLQKLLYFAQAWNLAIFKKPLFKEDFEAWVHGPVIPQVYREFKRFGYKPILIKAKKPSLTKKEEEFLDEVTRVYMKYDAFALELMTHREDPWKQARKGCAIDDPCDNIIPKDSIKRYYEKRMEEAD